MYTIHDSLTSHRKRYQKTSEWLGKVFVTHVTDRENVLTCKELLRIQGKDRRLTREPDAEGNRRLPGKEMAQKRIFLHPAHFVNDEVMEMNTIVTRPSKKCFTQTGKDLKIGNKHYWWEFGGTSCQ